MFDALMLKTPDLKGLRNAVSACGPRLAWPEPPCAPAHTLLHALPHHSDFPREGSGKEHDGSSLGVAVAHLARLAGEGGLGGGWGRGVPQ